MKKNFVSGPDSALAQLPFPVQLTISSSTKLSFNYFSFGDLCLTELCDCDCTLTFLGDPHPGTKQAQNGVALSLSVVSGLCSSVPSSCNQMPDICS